MSEDNTFNGLLNNSLTAGEDAGMCVNHTYLHYLLLAMLKHLEIEDKQIQWEDDNPVVTSQQFHTQCSEALTLARELQRRNDSVEKEIKVLHDQNKNISKEISELHQKNAHVRNAIMELRQPECKRQEAGRVKKEEKKKQLNMEEVALLLKTAVEEQENEEENEEDVSVY